jgi:hypothetical protein
MDRRLFLFPSDYVRYDVAVIVAAIHQMKLAGFHSRAMALVKEYAGGMLELAQFRMC